MGLQYIDSMYIDSPGGTMRILQLCMGDVSNMDSHDRVDFLVVSSLPGDYSPVPGSVIGALNQQGVSVNTLSQNKAANYAPVMPCWISQPVYPENPKIQFNRVLLFEPTDPASSAQGLIPDLFRALKCFNKFNAVTVAIPMVCTKSGGADIAQVFYGLFFGATFGQSSYTSPITTVKLIVSDQKQLDQVRPLFSRFKNNYTDILNLNLPGGYKEYAASCWDWAHSASLPLYINSRQAFGIRLYSSNYYIQLNAVLRLGNPNDPLYMDMMPVFDAINAGLANLPDGPGMTYRGENNMTPARINQWTPGNRVINLAYTSTARPPGFWYNDAPFKFNINGLECKSISSYSEFPNENEFLYAPDLNQEVVSRNCNSGNVKCTFEANEIVPNWCN